MYTARRNMLHCTSGLSWVVKFMNQNLTFQATESNKQYSRLTVYNMLEGQTDCPQITNFCLCKIATANDIREMALSGPPLSNYIQNVGNQVSLDPQILVPQKILGSTNHISSKSIESCPCACAVECYEQTISCNRNWLRNVPNIPKII